MNKYDPKWIEYDESFFTSKKWTVTAEKEEPLEPHDEYYNAGFYQFKEYTADDGWRLQIHYYHGYGGSYPCVVPIPPNYTGELYQLYICPRNRVDPEKVEELLE